MIGEGESGDGDEQGADTQDDDDCVADAAPSLSPVCLVAYVVLITGPTAAPARIPQ